MPLTIEFFGKGYYTGSEGTVTVNNPQGVYIRACGTPDGGYIDIANARQETDEKKGGFCEFGSYVTRGDKFVQNIQGKGKTIIPVIVTAE